MAAEINLQQNCQISERNINFSQNYEQKTSTGVILKVSKLMFRQRLISWRTE